MKLKPYSELIKLSKEKVDEFLSPLRAKKAKAQAELEIAKLEEKLASTENAINEACAELKIDFQKIIRLQDEYALTERKSKQFKKIIEEFFPD